MFELSDDVPLPQHRSIKYPFGSMKVGDSFLVPEQDRSSAKLRGAATAYSKKHDGFKFTVRTVEGGARCWRIA